MTHVAIQKALDGNTVTWTEKVADGEYLREPSAWRSDAAGTGNSSVAAHVRGQRCERQLVAARGPVRRTQ